MQILLHHFGANSIGFFEAWVYKSFMEAFRNHLQQEFMARSGRNPSYSLRAFALQIGMSHATLSTMISGKRKITKTAALKIAKSLGLSPNEMNQLIGEDSSKSNQNSIPYFILQNDAFSLISEWYYDAILELSLIKNIKIDSEVISKSLGITKIQAKLALETLERLDLLAKNENEEYVIQHQNTTNILDKDFTTTAQKKYQHSILEKSIEALGSIDRKERDHTSTTMAINKNDLPKVKELIQKFRYDLNNYLQRDNVKLNEVYQLQVSFFPVSQNSKCKE